VLGASTGVYQALFKTWIKALYNIELRKYLELT
jgi:hypothetical protein